MLTPEGLLRPEDLARAHVLVENLATLGGAAFVLSVLTSLGQIGDASVRAVDLEVRRLASGDLGVMARTETGGTYRSRAGT